MNIQDILTIYDYNYWATRQILAACAHVSPKQFTTSTAHSFGSLRGTLVHTLGSEHGWRMLLQHRTLAYFHILKEGSFSILDVLEQRWEEEERTMREYLASLTDDDLVSIVRYTTDEGDRRERVLWHCLLHVVNHGTHHRSEAAAILTGYGHSPGGLDFTAFLNEQE
ncbi:MAG TPA: DinB family protein [Anaerolineales bacterium]|nr:DinB family protein [Anaerolineales bacterium]